MHSIFVEQKPRKFCRRIDYEMAVMVGQLCKLMPVCVEHETSVAELLNECVASREASAVS